MPARLQRETIRGVEMGMLKPDNLTDEDWAELSKLIQEGFTGFAFVEDNVFEAYGFNAIFFAYGNTEEFQSADWPGVDPIGNFMIQLSLDEARERGKELSDKMQVSVIIVDGDALKKGEQS